MRSVAGLARDSLFTRTLLLALGTILLSQALSLAVFATLPLPRPDHNHLSDIADVLTGRADFVAPPDRARFTVTRMASPPQRPSGMIEQPVITSLFARLVAMSPAHVRFFFRPDTPLPFPLRLHRAYRPVALVNGEPVFYGGVVAAVQSGSGWLTFRSIGNGGKASFLVQVAIWFALCALLVAPLAWLFARRLAAPLRRLADVVAAHNSDGPAAPLPVAGPDEVRIVARALNVAQDRMAEYTRERTMMLAAIAHDLRTPLARIAFRIEEAPDAVRAPVQGDIEQMRTMLSETIAFARGGVSLAVPAPVDLAAMLREIVAREAAMGHRVTLGSAPPLWTPGHVSALTRMVQNLIDNALRYAGDAHVVLLRDGSDAVVIVTDHGPGLAPELMQRVLAPFVRGEPSRNRATGGVGLGLSISAGIAARHGGHLALEPARGGGLMVRVTLPLAIEQPALAVAADQR